MRRLIPTTVLVLLGAALMMAGTAARGFASPTAEATPTPRPSGERLYRLYCVSCHGDRLRGLTAEWIAQWPATHQNCWLAKCHGPNPPPDGFTLPRQAPALAGAGALARFRTVADLFGYVRAAMPYQEPGILTEEQYGEILSYVLAQNGLTGLPVPLTVANAGGIDLNPEVAPAPTPTGSTPAATESPSRAPPATILAVSAGGAILGLVGLGLLLNRRRRGRAGSASDRMP